MLSPESFRELSLCRQRHKERVVRNTPKVILITPKVMLITPKVILVTPKENRYDFGLTL